MNPELEQRISAIKAACEEILRLSEKATAGPWSPAGNLVKCRDGFVADCYGGEEMEEETARFIAASRNVSPAMARVVLGVLERCNSLADERHHGRPYLAMLEYIANQWECK